MPPLPISPDIVWWAHVFATWYMTGLIWFVQCVHYPLMNQVAADRYAAFQLQHMRRTTWVVAPAMLLEAFTAAALIYVRPDTFPQLCAWLNFAVVLGIWMSTAFLQVPCHHQLERGFSARAHTMLVRTNWLRTAAWTVRAASLAWVAAM